MSTYNSLKRYGGTYFAGQWAEAGVYRCLDTWPPEEKIVILAEDGILPDPTHGWVARFHRIRGREAERILAARLARQSATCGTEWQAGLKGCAGDKSVERRRVS